MTGDSTGPPKSSLADEFGSTLADQPADERVYRVAVQLAEPTRVGPIAERADCAADTARRHLRRLVDIGVLQQDSSNPDAFSRNESYFEWRKRNELAQLSEAALRERLQALTEREGTFQDRYDADNPGSVDALDHADHRDVETVWMELSEWQTVRERIERLEAVRQRRHGEPGVA